MDDIATWLTALLIALCVLWALGWLPDHEASARKQCEAQHNAWVFDQATQRHVCVPPGTHHDVPVR
jgi:hypothetical protein